MSYEYSVLTKDHLVLPCEDLVVTRCELVMTSHCVVGIRESLVVLCDSLVVSMYYLVRICSFLCFLFCPCSASDRLMLDL